MIDDSGEPLARPAERTVLAALRAPRVLARCRTVAAGGALALAGATILATTALRSNPLAYEAMLAATFTIVASMTVATLVSMSVATPAERSSFPT